MDPVEILTKFIKINSTTGNENTFTVFLAAMLKDLGYTVEFQTVSEDPLQQNILAYRGSRDNIRLVLNSHMDTVPPYIEFREDSESLYGRGSCDAKGSIATQITAAQNLFSTHGDVGIAYLLLLINTL